MLLYWSYLVKKLFLKYSFSLIEYNISSFISEFTIEEKYGIYLEINYYFWISALLNCLDTKSNSFFINIIQSVTSRATIVAPLFVTESVNAFSPNLFPVFKVATYIPSC